MTEDEVLDYWFAGDPATHRAVWFEQSPDFDAAWNAADDLDDNTEDGKAYNAAMDDVAGKCPQ